MKLRKLLPHIIGSALLALIAIQCADKQPLGAGGTSHARGNADMNLTNTTDGIELTYDIKDYNIKEINKNGTEYTQLLYKNSPLLENKGFAELPFLSVTLQIPANQNVVAKVTTADEFDEHPLQYPLLPSRGTIYRNQNPDEIPYQIAGSSKTDAWYPNSIVNQTAPFIFRDVRGITIHIYPFQYRASDMTLRIYSKLKLSVVATDDTPVNALELTDDQPHTVTPTMDQVYQSVFANYNQGAFADDGLKIGEKGDLLVILTGRDEQAIKPYIEWKKEKGFKVTTIIVPKGTNVKKTIAEAYNNNKNLLYVQLVGGWADIKSDTGPQSAPTDPTLGCVSGNDNVPDLIIGRFPAKSSDQLAIEIAKAIAYERDPDTNNGSWYKTALGIASPEGQGQGDDSEADYEHMANIRNNKLLPYTYNVVYEAYQYPNKQTIVQYINKGVSLINYTGHGSETGWVTSNYSVSDVHQSTNGNKLPIIFSVACVNGAFHSGKESFAESFMNEKNGGAVATLMSTINQPWTPPMRGQDYMNDIIVHGYEYGKHNDKGINVSGGRNTFGSIVLNGLVLMYTESSAQEDLDTLQTWTTFGDASLEIRTDEPKQIRTSETSLKAGLPFETSVFSTTDNIAVTGASVSVYQNGKSYSAATNEQGRVSITHDFEKGPAVLVITGYNLKTIFTKTSVL